MKLNLANNPILEIAACLALSTLIISAALATIIQMQKDMLAAESVTHFSSSSKSQTLVVGAADPYLNIRYGPGRH